MSGLNLISSNRLEFLALHFAELVRAEPLPPLEAEIVVVQSKGMARWLAMELAAECSVWANVHCPFPTAIVEQMIRRVLPEREFYGTSKEEIIWRLFGLFSDLEKRAAFLPLQHYLADGRPLKRYQLALYLADLFDQYQVYRPEMVLGWDQGKDDSWQAELWRQVFSRDKTDKAQHRVVLLKEFSARLQAAPPPDGVPCRINLFGISSLPPFHLHVFEALSKHIKINFYLLNPCGEFWADILSEEEGRRDRRRFNRSAADLYHHTGNSLLASMGQLGRDFFASLQNRHHQEYPVFTEPRQDHLLGRIQNDILKLNDAGMGDSVNSVDDSIQVYSCHSPLREVEVLRDHLLALFEKNPDLRPREIIVMMPDIETYSPYIEAVFGISAKDPHWIPYSVADRSLGGEAGPAGIFLAVLELSTGRFEAGRVLKILESPFVHKHFGMSGEDVERIEQWVGETAIYWGIDEPHRQKQGGYAFSQNTWRAGIDRLLLGYAMGEGRNELFAGLLPFGPVEGDEVQILGRFAECCEVLFSYAEKLAEPRSLSGWSQVLSGLLADCFFEDEEDTELTRLRTILAEMADMEKQAASVEPLAPEVIFAHLRRLLEQQASPFGFLTGGVTFCAMLPMRAIPSKILCLLGMNDADFPRPVNSLSFDLMAQEPRPGDRSRRHADRYLFLEAILSAREELYISFVGQSQHDDSQTPPSVLVSELLDYIRQMQAAADDPSAEETLVVRHRLQSFHQEYFRPGSALGSFSAENYQAALALHENRQGGPLFLEAIAEPDSEWRQIDLDRLCRFFSNPAREFCRQRLGVQLPKNLISPLDQEPRTLDGFVRYGFQQEILAAELAGSGLDDFLKQAHASGKFPPGRVGEAIITDLWSQCSILARKVEHYTQHDPVSLEVDLELDGFQVVGKLAGVYDSGLVTYRTAKVKAADQFSLWIRHLVLQCLVEPDELAQSIHVGSDKVYAIGHVRGARSILQDLLNYYWQGLTRPLLFFPTSSLVFALEKSKGRSDGEALHKAGAAWRGNDFQVGEGNDPFYRLCFRDWLPLTDPAFSRLATDCFSPLLSAMETITG